MDNEIKRDLAVAMSKAYETRRASHKPEVGREDTKYVYINREILQDYLNRNENAIGIKVYFGVIDDHIISSNANYRCDPKYKKQTTIILKATGDSSIIDSEIPVLIAIPNEKTNPEGEPLDEFGLCPPPVGKCTEIY